MDRWQKPLEKKKLKRARKLEREATKEPPEPQDQLLVVHGMDGEENVELTQPDYGMFAVVKIEDRQYKVMKDETIMLEKLPFEVGDKLTLDKVLLVGTKDYTSIGRPFIESARVLASVEEQVKC